jgi:alkylhydroperoxidase/carboxymuconolactone decarboxylase family protein YurZ
MLSAVVSQNLVGPTLSHLRGCLRTGMEKEEVELIHQVIELVAGFAGRKLDAISRVGDVKDEMFERFLD